MDEKIKRAASILTRSLFRTTGRSRRHSPPVPEKPCVVCGKPKRHNNAFCSAECCWTYKTT